MLGPAPGSARVGWVIVLAGTAAVLAPPLAPPVVRTADADTASKRDRAGHSAFARGVRLFRQGSYEEAARLLAQPQARPAKNEDWLLYLRAESAFYAGDHRAARTDYERLAKLSGKAGGSRFTAVAAFRAADCLWAIGSRAAAAAEYQRLLKRGGPSGVDIAVARFRVALVAEEQRAPDAPRLFAAVHREFPAHPLAAQAAQHFGADTAAAAPAKPHPGASASAEDRLKRAETLTRERHWDEALAELDRLPPNLPPGLRAERDYQIGMTKFQMRRDYGRAAELLLGAEPALTGEKAASALFHGTRALSRVDRDDEAIAGYKKVVARFPSSRYAAEAQFLSGWLDYNRGRYRESLPGLRTTLDRFGRSGYADDAAWCLAFAHYLLGELDQAAAALDRYAAMPLTGMTADERSARVAYWRARILAKRGRVDDAKTGYREISRRWPFSFYGLAARSRLAETGERVIVELPKQAAAGALPPVPSNAAKDPAVARAEELRATGLDVEGGWELQRDERGVFSRFGDARGLAVLFDRYPDLQAYRRAYQLAESRGLAALAADPSGPARVIWEAAYPKAFRTLVEAHAGPAGTPELFLYSIMRKESGFSPWDVSSADARGLLQMIPPTSAKVAASAGLPFFADELYDPAVNIKLGALYIGGLYRKFGGQIPLVAGAFNAGPKAMARWCDQHGKRQTDELVELIAFTQTREYAKRVTSIYARYRALYGPSPYELPLTVDARYAKDGPDF